MGVSERRKGLRGQQEVQRIVRDAGLTIRKLGGEGDALVQARDGLTLHLETKRQERLQLPIWLRQAEDEAPKGAVAVVVFRQKRQRRAEVRSAKAGVEDDRTPLDRGEWYACLPLDDLVRLAS